MPSPFTQIIFPITEPIDISEIAKPMDEPFVAPILGCFKRIKIRAGSVNFGIHINPVVASQYFSTKPAELIRNANPIREVFRRGFYNQLRDEVLGAPDFESRVDRVLKLFGSSASLKGKTNKLLGMTLHSMSVDPGQSISKVSKDFGFSERWLQKTCRETIGATPKEMMRIIRFNRFVNLLYYSSPTSGIIQWALESGYYDQAHATREFKKLGGFTPHKFYREKPELSRLLNYYF